MSELPKDETVPPVGDPATSAPAVVEPAEAPAPDANKLVAPAGWEPTFPDDAPKIQVKFDIQDFEGPLDLLLHLVKEHQLDLFDIPIEKITESYLATLVDGSLKYLQIHFETETVLEAGPGAAAALGRMSARVHRYGGEREIAAMTLALWVREGDAWRLLAYQPTSLPKA